MKNFIKSIRWLLVIAAVVIAVDQVTKALVRANLEYGEIWAPWDWMLPYARLLHINNTGAAFGMFKGMNVVFIILASVVSAGIIYYYPQVPKEDRIVRFALSLQLAGAVGNLIDRIVFGTVTDFVSVGNFAVWNIADASITVGVAILLIGVWIQDKKEKNKQAPTDSEESVHESGNES